ncbi:hypothetical protein H1Z61_08185 [Bacillus aquiflavi]|uniref:DUF4025 domain-containing protein n=1 Tax=Bacillus aquiflavi TaxID=2672567 RepID=A0A7W2AEK3_9BACI|nr:hypothetical protein [Bacillus aquiflavi]MBA4537124.1 hypothetical protein [Bacillus aquiflavi]UAC47554.1 hypothetical protein K6959_12840 [Bacillus aquiflavi]
MKKREIKENIYYDEEGAEEISEQIKNSYTSGVVNQPDAQFDIDELTKDSHTKE